MTKHERMMREDVRAAALLLPPGHSARVARRDALRGMANQREDYNAGGAAAMSRGVDDAACAVIAERCLSAAAAHFDDGGGTREQRRIYVEALETQENAWVEE